MTISSPLAASSTRRDRCVFAAWMLTVRIAFLSNRTKLSPIGGRQQHANRQHAINRGESPKFGYDRSSGVGPRVADLTLMKIGPLMPGPSQAYRNNFPMKYQDYPVEESITLQPL